MSKTSDRGPLHSLMATAMADMPGNEGIKRSLRAIRAHLGMDVAYVSKVVGESPRVLPGTAAVIR